MKIDPLTAKKIRLFLIPGIIILAVTLLSSQFLIPRIQETQELFDKLQADRKVLETIENKAKKLKELKKSSLLSDYEKLEFVLPSEKNVPFIFTSYGNQEYYNDVTFQGLGLNPGFVNKDKSDIEITAKNFDNLSLALNIKGSEENILKFLDGLFTTAPLSNILSSNFTLDSDNSSTSIAVNTYYQALPETLGKLDTPLRELNPKQKETLEKALSLTIYTSDPPIKTTDNEATESGKPDIGQGIFSM